MLYEEKRDDFQFEEITIMSTSCLHYCTYLISCRKTRSLYLQSSGTSHLCLNICRISVHSSTSPLGSVPSMQLTAFVASALQYLIHLKHAYSNLSLSINPEYISLTNLPHLIKGLEGLFRSFWTFLCFKRFRSGHFQMSLLRPPKPPSYYIVYHSCSTLVHCQCNLS